MLSVHATTDSKNIADNTAGVLRDEGRQAGVAEVIAVRGLLGLDELNSATERYAVLIDG